MDVDGCLRRLLSLGDSTISLDNVANKMSLAGEIGRAKNAIEGYTKKEEYRKDARQALHFLDLTTKHIEEGDAKKTRESLKQATTYVARLKAMMNIIERARAREDEERKKAAEEEKRKKAAEEEEAEEEEVEDEAGGKEGGEVGEEGEKKEKEERERRRNRGNK